MYYCHDLQDFDPNTCPSILFLNTYRNRSPSGFLCIATKWMVAKQVPTERVERKILGSAETQIYVGGAGGDGGEGSPQRR